MQGAVKAVIDTGVDRPVLLYVLAALLSAVAVWLIPQDLTRTFIAGSISAIPGVAFSLFGFAVTAISILVSLKGSPFFDLLQRERFSLWKALIGAFTHEASLFAAFGVAALLFPTNVVEKIVGTAFTVFSFTYLFLFLAVMFATAMAVYLLRLVANAPPLEQPATPPIDTSALGAFVNPTDLLPPRDL